MIQLSKSSEDRLLWVYEHPEHYVWILPHAKPLLRTGVVEYDEPTGTYYVTQAGIDYLKQKRRI